MSIDLEAAAAGESTFEGMIKRQFTKPLRLPDIALTSQIAIVTGANAGLGYEACRHLLGLGLPRLIMGVRSPSKGDRAADLLRGEFPSSTIDVWVVDMTSYESVRRFQERTETLPRLDIVILNAGMMAVKHEFIPSTGHESTIQVNYLSTALLSLLLLSRLKASAAAVAPSDRNGMPPVMTIVGSDVMYSQHLPDLLSDEPILSRWDSPGEFSPLKAYGISKILLMIFVWKLSERVDASEVLVNVSNPGMTGGTAFFDKSPYLLRKVMGLLQAVLARSSVLGATTYLDAVLGHGTDSHGGFVSDWAIKP